MVPRTAAPPGARPAVGGARGLRPPARGRRWGRERSLKDVQNRRCRNTVRPGRNGLEAGGGICCLAPPCRLRPKIWLVLTAAGRDGTGRDATRGGDSLPGAPPVRPRSGGFVTSGPPARSRLPAITGTGRGLARGGDLPPGAPPARLGSGGSLRSGPPAPRSAPRRTVRRADGGKPLSGVDGPLVPSREVAGASGDLLPADEGAPASGETRAPRVPQTRPRPTKKGRASPSQGFASKRRHSPAAASAEAVKLYDHQRGTPRVPRRRRTQRTAMGHVNRRTL
jgi:hypothetical protein